MSRKPFSVLASLFLVLAIIVSCSPDPAGGYPSVDCTITLNTHGYDEQLTENKFHIVGNKGLVLPVLEGNDMVSFVGWSTVENDSSKIVETVDGVFYPTENKDITLHAVWANKRVTIYYYYNYVDKEELFHTATFDYNRWDKLGSKYKSIEDSNEGVAFAGWSYEKEAKIDDLMSEQEVRNMPLPLEDIKLFAQWKKPVEIFLKSGDTVVDTLTLNAFDTIGDKIKEIEEPTRENAKFAWWNDENEEKVTESTVVYKTCEYEAVFGEKVTLKFFDNNGEEINNISTESLDNYEYFEYKLPDSNEVEKSIPGFVGWSTETGDIVSESNVIGKVEETGENEKVINLYARLGIKATIEVETEFKEEMDKGFVIFEDGNIIENRYPHLGEYYPPKGIYVDADMQTLLIDENGNLVENLSGYTENGKLIWQPSENNDTLKLYVDWTDPKKVDGAIMYKYTDTNVYEFYDGNFNKLKEDTAERIPRYYTETADNVNPVYYVINGEPTEEINYAIVYNGFENNTCYMPQGVLYNEKSDYSAITIETSGIANTRILIEQDKSNDKTLGYYANIANAGFDEIVWFVPSKLEMEVFFKDKATYAPFDNFLGIPVEGPILTSSFENSKLCLYSTSGEYKFYKFNEYARAGFSFLIRQI